MAAAACLEVAAARLRAEAQRIDGAVDAYLTPAFERLPDTWRGPAADRLAQQLLGHRTVLRSVADDLARKSVELEVRAAQLRATGVPATGDEAIAVAL